MVKLTEVEDEHFSNEKPIPSKRDTLLASDDEEDDFTDTGTKKTHSLYTTFPEPRLNPLGTLKKKNLSLTRC